MELDDEVCLCFHVSKRKLLSYMRINKVRMRRAGEPVERVRRSGDGVWVRSIAA